MDKKFKTFEEYQEALYDRLEQLRESLGMEDYTNCLESFVGLDTLERFEDYESRVWEIPYEE